MAASIERAMFLKSIDSSGKIKDAEYVADIFLSVIQEVGDANVVLIITNNGSNFKAVGLLVEKRYPHIFWTPCVVHYLNLALQSMCCPLQNFDQYTECKWIVDLIDEVKTVRNFVVNHSMALAIFNDYSKLRLLRVAETRFAYHIIMAKRLKKVKSSLEQMVLDSKWRFYIDEKSPIEMKAREVKQYIVDDSWWDKIDYFLNFIESIMNMLRATYMDSLMLHLVYDMWDTMIEKVKDIIFDLEGQDMISGQSIFFEIIQKILEKRWTKSNTPLHCMAHSLVPKYYSNAWHEARILGTRRLAPNEDQEVSMHRNECFKRFYPDELDLRKIYLEYGAFFGCLGYFGESHVIEARMYEEPISWWANCGSSTPYLKSLSFKLLSQPASSSCCERNWSTYSTIQCIKRNRLATSRAEDLVFVHSNLCLLSRKKSAYKDGPTKYWDICADKFDINGENLEDLAELSIDEPNLESVVFEE